MGVSARRLRFQGEYAREYYICEIGLNTCHSVSRRGRGVTSSKRPAGLSSRATVLIGIFVIVLVVRLAVPAPAAVRTSATAKQWPASFGPHDFFLAPGGTGVFSPPRR